MISFRTLPVVAALLAFTFLSSCACIASSGCSGKGSQAQLDLNVNWNAALTTQEKIYVCTNYTQSQTFYGSTCTISWK